MVIWAFAISALAVEPPWRWVTSDQGLVAEHVDDLAQAPDGFLWLATHAGVYRLDGDRAVRQDGGVLANEVFRLVIDDAGHVFARMGQGELYEVGEGTARHVTAADGAPARAQDLDVDASGVAWALSAGRLWRISGGRLVLDPDLGEVRGGEVARHRGTEGWIVGARSGWYAVEPGASARRLVDAERPVDARGTPDGSVWIVDTGHPEGGRVRRLDPGGGLVFDRRFASRAFGVALDGTRAWISFDQLLVQVAADDTVQVWGPERGVRTGGRPLVDDEGSLWIPTFRGVAQLFEPDAALWEVRDGLPAEATRFVIAQGDTVWISGWGGAAWLDPATGPVVPVEDPVVKGGICADSAGGVWGVGTAGLNGPPQIVRMTREGAQRWPIATSTHFENGCATAADGGVWLTATEGLWYAAADAPPRLVAPWWDKGFARAWKSVDVDAEGRPWVAGNEDVCHLDEGHWTCLDGRPPSAIVDLALVDDDQPWIATASDGVSRRAGHGWEPLPGMAELPSGFVMGLRESPRGGVWVLGHGVVHRVVSRPDLPAGWSVEETLAGWLGHLVSGAQDLLELPNGDLWIGHNGGLTHIPAETRVPAARPPPVSLVDRRLDGAPVEGDAIAASSSALTTFEFVAASYVSPSRIRYRTRLDEGPWSPPGSHGTVELRDLAPGRHRVQAAATLNGLLWTDPPAEAWVVYPQPWYGRWQLWAGLGSLALLGTFVTMRVRADMALRLERLRSRIALDLHDQVGAGLGSIGLLGRPGLPAPAATEAARRVAATAEDLGLVLRGIVWSLRPESARLDLLGAHLAERARGLLPDLDGVGRLEIVVPDDRVVVDLDVLRATQLIGLEALHNVAKHANATWARLAIEPIEAGRWRLVVEDDGVGVGAGMSARVDGGNGLRGMRARAAELHLPIAIGPRDGKGTRVAFEFRPQRWFGR